MSYKEIIDFFGKEKIYEWLSQIPHFYYKPSAFFKNIFSKTVSEKISISLFYTLLTIGLVYIFSTETIREITKVIILEAVMVLVAFMLLNITRIFINKFFSSNLKAENVFIFLMLTKFFTIPLQVGFMILFYKTEMYEFLFLHNTTISLLIVFVYVYSNKIFYKNLKKIIFGSIINLILFNLLVICGSLLKFDKYAFDMQNPLFSDEIYDEFESKISPIDSLVGKFAYGKYILITPDKNRFIYTFETDSILSIYKEIGKKYQKSVEFEIEVFTAIKQNPKLRKNLKFKRNINLNDSLMAYLQYVKLDVQKPIDTSYTYLLDKKTITTTDGKYFAEINKITRNPSFDKTYSIYQNMTAQFYESKIISSYPLKIIDYLLYPASSCF